MRFCWDMSSVEYWEQALWMWLHPKIARPILFAWHCSRFSKWLLDEIGLSLFGIDPNHW